MKKKMKKLVLLALSGVLALSTVGIFASCNADPSESSSGGGTSSSSSDSTGQEEEIKPVTIPLTGTERYDFDVVAGYGKIQGYGSSVSEGVQVRSEEGVGSWLTGFTWNNNAKAQLNIYADADCQADVVLKVRKTSEIEVLTNKVSVSIGGEVIESVAEVGASQEGSGAEFDEVNLGRFWLSEGENKIEITPMDSTDNFDFMSVILYTDDASANLRWSALKDVSGTIFYGIDEHVELEGDYKKNLQENCIGVSGYTGAKATFPIFSSREAKVTVSVITCSMPVSNVFTNFYNFSINGERKSSSATTLYGPLWGDYGIVTLGEYVIDGGRNEISISAPAINDYTQHYNIRAIILDTDAEVSFTEVDAENHICLSVCPVCGGCLDDECEEEACAVKCSCVEEAFSATDGKVHLSSGLAINTEGNYVQVADYSAFVTLTFRFTASQAGKATLSFEVGGNPNAQWTFVDYFRVWVNVLFDSCNDTDGASLKLSKDVYTAQTVQGSFTTFSSIEIGEIDVIEGENTVTLGFTCVGNQMFSFNVKGMGLKSQGIEFALVDSGIAAAPKTQTLAAATYATIEKGKPDNSNDVGCAQQVDGSYQTALYYTIVAEKAGTAELSIVISSTTGGTYTATNVFATTINSAPYTSTATTVNDGIPWTSYHTILLGTIELQQGTNVIRFDHTHMNAGAAATNWGDSVNFRAIVLTTAVSYEVTAPQAA